MTELLLGLSLGLGAGLAPGPLTVLILDVTLRAGFAGGARVALAPLVTDVPIVVLCVLVLRELPEEALGALSLAGAVFVLRLAWESLHPPEAGAPRSGDLKRAALVNALSPHPWLFWITVGGPILVAAGGRGTGLAAAFVLGFYATLVGAKVAIAGLVAAGRRFTTTRAVPRVSAALLALAAIALAADGVHRLAG